MRGGASTVTDEAAFDGTMAHKHIDSISVIVGPPYQSVRAYLKLSDHCRYPLSCDLYYKGNQKLRPYKLVTV